MTSNVGADLIKKQSGIGFKTGGDTQAEFGDMKKKLLDATKKVFRPEFLNRVDDIVVFHQLEKKHLYDIIEIELHDLRKRLQEKQMKLELSEEAITFLIDKGFDQVYGARPLRRAIQRYIENVLSEEILGGKFNEGDAIKASKGEDENLVFDLAN
jgi:ATP-dependent Clp protease ATP-binding subunit ClpC